MTPLVPLAAIGAGLFLLVKIGQKQPPKDSGLLNTSGILPAIGTGNAVTGKSGAKYIVFPVGSDDTANTVRMQVLLNDGKNPHLILTFDQVRGDADSRTLVNRGPVTNDKTFTTAVEDFGVGSKT